MAFFLAKIKSAKLPDAWTRTTTKKTSELGGTGLTTVSLWGPPRAVAPLRIECGPSTLLALPCLTCCFSWISLDRGSGHCLALLGVFGSISLSSLILKASKVLILLTAWLTKSKSVKFLKTSKNKCNNRNKGIHHTLQHINPLNDSQTSK